MQRTLVLWKTKGVQFQRKVGLQPEEVNISKEEVVEQHKASLKALQDLRNKQDEKRDEFWDQAAEAIAEMEAPADPKKKKGQVTKKIHQEESEAAH
jgi:hypothetical protein